MAISSLPTQHQRLPVEALDVIIQALILSKVTYALQAFAGHISLLRIEIDAVDLLIKFLTLVV